MNIDELSCKLECHDLIVRYFALLDLGPRSQIADLFSEDGEIVREKLDGGVKGKDIQALFERLPAELVPIHLATNILITPTGPRSATGEVYTVAFNMFGKADDVLPRNMPPTPSRIGKLLFGFRKTDVGWRISSFEPGHRFVDDGLT